MPDVRVSLLGLMQAAAVITVVFSVVTLLAIDHFGIQLFTHFRLQYLIVSILFLLLYRWLQSPWLIGAVAITVVINAVLVLPWYFGKQDSSDGTELKLLHVNVLSHNTEHDRLTELVETEQPDVIVLQEVSPQWVAALKTLQVNYPFGKVEAREGNFGIALLSRLPLTSITAIDSPPLTYPSLVADAVVGGRTLRIVTSHPTIPLGSNLFGARNEQLDSVPSLFGSGTDASLFVGDLNASLWDIHYRSFERVTGLRSARKGFGIVPTWPTYMPFAMIPIDHVLVSDAINVRDVHSGSRIGSDHLPLVVTISL